MLSNERNGNLEEVAVPSETPLKYFLHDKPADDDDAEAPTAGRPVRIRDKPISGPSGRGSKKCSNSLVRDRMSCSACA